MLKKINGMYDYFSNAARLFPTETMRFKFHANILMLVHYFGGGFLYFVVFAVFSENMTQMSNHTSGEKSSFP